MASTAGQIQTGTNDTLFDGRIPLFETNNVVYVRAELNTAGQKTFTQVGYRVLYWFVKTDGAGVLLDANGAAAVGSVAANVATDNVTPDTNAQWPYFYRVVATEGTNQNQNFEFHESALLNLAGANSVRDANDWV